MSSKGGDPDSKSGSQVRPSISGVLTTNLAVRKHEYERGKVLPMLISALPGRISIEIIVWYGIKYWVIMYVFQYYWIEYYQIVHVILGNIVICNVHIILSKIVKIPNSILHVIWSNIEKYWFISGCFINFYAPNFSFLQWISQYCSLASLLTSGIAKSGGGGVGRRTSRRLSASRYKHSLLPWVGCVLGATRALSTFRSRRQPKSPWGQQEWIRARAFPCLLHFSPLGKR